MSSIPFAPDSVTSAHVKPYIAPHRRAAFRSATTNTITDESSFSGESEINVLINKIFRFASAKDRQKIKNTIMNVPLVPLARIHNSASSASSANELERAIETIAAIVKPYANDLKKDEHRQDFITDQILKALRKYIPVNDKLVIADIGGGNGNVISGINDKLNGPPANFICVETETDWMEAYKRDNANITYKFWNNETVDIADHSCDVVLCMVSLHHMTEPTCLNALQEIRRIMKKGGLLLIKEHDSDSDRTAYIVDWEHYLYHIMDSMYDTTNSDNEVDAHKYISSAIHNFQPASYWKERIERRIRPMSGGPIESRVNYWFEQVSRTNRTLDGLFVKGEVKNPTHLYWDIYQC